jgi:hypothetical protein
MTAETGLILIPLVVLIAIVVTNEIRTDMIWDALTLPAMVYMFIARLIIGPDKWYMYLAAPLFVALFFYIIGSVLPTALGKSAMIGFGAIKLLMVSAAALGLTNSLGLSVIFIVSCLLWYAIGHFAIGTNYIPSSPNIGLAVLAVIALRYL